MAATEDPPTPDAPPTSEEQRAHRRSLVAVAKATGTARQLEAMLQFHQSEYEWRRLFSELLGPSCWSSWPPAAAS